MMAQILSAFLFLELYSNLQFIPFMQFLATHIRAGWGTTLLNLGEPFPSNFRDSNMSLFPISTKPIAPDAIINLCLSELSTISYFTPSFVSLTSLSRNDGMIGMSRSAIPEPIRSLLPVEPTELLCKQKYHKRYHNHKTLNQKY